MNTRPLPVAFVGHGSPMLALDAERGAPLRAWGAERPPPRGVLVVSAHWEGDGLLVSPGGAQRFDFAGFPERLSRVRYAPPRAEALAAEASALLGARVVERALDHGAWVPLVHVLSGAEVPVAQLALPRGAAPEEDLALGARLAPLRDRGVLVLGSGAVVHDLARVDWSDTSPPPCWADDFDHWVGEVLEAGDLAALAGWRAAPGAALAHPTDEHLRPLLVVAGAARPGDVARTFVRGFELGSISRRSVQLG